MTRINPTSLARRKLLGAAMALAATHPLRAQGAKRPIRLIVPFPAGGLHDLIARAVAEPWASLLDQPVMVENRPGASGNLGAEAVAHAAPDGLTLLWAQGSTHGANSTFFRRLPYDPLADFAPVGLVSTTPLVLLGRTDLEADDLDGLITLGQARPGRLNIGTGGVGTTPHMAAALFARHTGITWTTVPYCGNAAALNDLLSRHIDLLFEAVHVALPLVRQGRVRAYAITGAERSSLLPDVPTAQAVLGHFRVTIWGGVAAPAGTAPAIVERLSRSLLGLDGVAPLKARLGELGVALRPADPAVMRAVTIADIARWRELFEDAGVTVE